jgi:hypothetical protein
MEQEHLDPRFQELYNRYIRLEKEEADRTYQEMQPELRLPETRRTRWWIPAIAATVVILITGTWILTTTPDLFPRKTQYTEAEVRESLEKTIRALSTCSKTVKQEFGQVENLTAMTGAIKPSIRNANRQTTNIDPNTTKN